MEDCLNWIASTAGVANDFCVIPIDELFKKIYAEGKKASGGVTTDMFDKAYEEVVMTKRHVDCDTLEGTSFGFLCFLLFSFALPANCLQLAFRRCLEIIFVQVNVSSMYLGRRRGCRLSNARNKKRLSIAPALARSRTLLESSPAHRVDC